MVLYHTDFLYYPWMQVTSTDYSLVDQCGGSCSGGPNCYGLTDACDSEDSRLKYFIRLRYIDKSILNCPSATWLASVGTDDLLARIGYFQVGVTYASAPARYITNAADQPFLSDRTFMPAGWPAPMEGVNSYCWSHHVAGDPQGLNTLYADTHVEWLAMSKCLWWGPFPGYGTTQRCLIPPNSKCCYSGGPPAGWCP
jgi:hypothetical protein